MTCLSKSTKDTLNINDLNTLYSLQVAKYNKNEFQDLQDLKKTGEGFIDFQLKLMFKFMLKNSSLWLFP